VGGRDGSCERKESVLQREHDRLNEEHDKLKQLYERTRFENEGRKIAWEIHRVDEYIASKKTLRNPGKSKAVGFFRKEETTLQESAWALYIKVSVLADWNRIFDEGMKPLIIPDRKGKHYGITAEMVKTIIEAAREWKTQGRRLRERSFTDHLRKGHNIDLSRKTVSDILVANDLHRVSTRRRRPRFYQSIRQTVPNGLISIDGSEMAIVIDHVPHTFNLEMAVDVRSYCHSAFHIGNTETSEEVISVMEEHIVNHGLPLGMLADHRSGNLSSETLSYLKRKG